MDLGIANYSSNVENGFLKHFLLTYVCLLASSEFICYDDGCDLRKYACNPIRRDLTATTQKIAKMNIVVDKMHMARHVNSWCKHHCDSRKYKELDKV